MNLHIVIPMPSEAQLRQWEQGLTRVVARSPSFEIRDPAFLPRQPNPVVGIRTEDGEVIWP